MPTPSKIVYNDAKFRKQFPAFADATVWPEETLTLYWGIARDDFVVTIDSPCNGLHNSSLQLAVDLMCAHLSTLMAIPPAGAGEGDGGGATSSGILTSASIGAVSVGMMQPPVKGMWDYWFAQTPYGQQLLALLAIKGVGGLYVGGLPERSAFRKVGGVFF
jgi:hypothetical protein